MYAQDVLLEEKEWGEGENQCVTDVLLVQLRRHYNVHTA